ncbi:hypothetical protein IVA87_30720 [Bradyrhizobium sp. 147]|uniref:hypothetical protein n=1 Tax=unclassified Bradyrhizobium TaxID=2631580 RepID=UPI001FF9BA71|nr:MULTISPECIES: hypothetical protein [unclassified Bradyrhizobium]MCK1542730.1 hypothetical protein [Bradyrhizobium sp. 179]MCK1622010.1 hypothetical protein [Bradyrhizobium sp. 160]MCK1683643.1 hypothetical protein [Bradyrhizobium sp. 147]
MLSIAPAVSPVICNNRGIACKMQSNHDGGVLRSYVAEILYMLRLATWLSRSEQALPIVI